MLCVLNPHILSHLYGCSNVVACLSCSPVRAIIWPRNHSALINSICTADNFGVFELWKRLFSYLILQSWYSWCVCSQTSLSNLKELAEEWTVKTLKTTSARRHSLAISPNNGNLHCCNILIIFHKTYIFVVSQVVEILNWECHIRYQI